MSNVTKTGAAVTAPQFNNTTTLNVEVSPMNNTHFATAQAVLSTYKADITRVTSQQAMMNVASTARRLHTDWAYNRLAEGVYNASIAKAGERKQQMLDLWSELETHAKAVAYGYKAGLVLTRSTTAQRNAVLMDLHPIALPIGDSRTYTAITSLPQLQQVLKTEPKLLDSLKRNGSTLVVKGDLQRAWANAPKWLRAEITSRVTSTKYAAPEDKATIRQEGKTKIVKAKTFAAMTALENGGLTFRIRMGAERALQQAMRLSYQYADSMEFWVNVNPSAPKADEADDEIYAGEEDQQYSSPIRTYTVTGRTNKEQHHSKVDIFDSIREDFEEAQEAAETLFLALETLLLKVGEVTYMWRVINADAGEFLPITNLSEALEMLTSNQQDYYARRMASSMGLEATSSGKLESEILKGFSPEEQQALIALAGGAI